MKYTETDKNGQSVIRFKTDRKYTQAELAQQREEFDKEAKAGKVICLSDLMINHGM